MLSNRCVLFSTAFKLIFCAVAGLLLCPIVGLKPFDSMEQQRINIRIHHLGIEIRYQDTIELERRSR